MKIVQINSLVHLQPGDIVLHEPDSPYYSGVHNTVSMGSAAETDNMSDLERDVDVTSHHSEPDVSHHSDPDVLPHSDPDISHHSEPDISPNSLHAFQRESDKESMPSLEIASNPNISYSPVPIAYNAQVKVWRVKENYKQVMNHPQLIRPTEFYLDWAVGGVYDPLSFSHRILLDGKNIQQSLPLHPSVLTDFSPRLQNVLYDHTSFENLLTTPPYFKCKDLWYEFLPEEFISDTISAFTDILNRAAIRHRFDVPNFQINVQSAIDIDDRGGLMGVLLVPFSATRRDNPMTREHLTLKLALCEMQTPLHIVQTLLHEFAHMLADFSPNSNPSRLNAHDMHWVRGFAFLIQELSYVTQGHALYSLFQTACGGFDKTWADFLYIWPCGCD
jgi:hypothetical protein